MGKEKISLGSKPENKTPQRPKSNIDSEAKAYKELQYWVDRVTKDLEKFGKNSEEAVYSNEKYRKAQEQYNKVLERKMFDRSRAIITTIPYQQYKSTQMKAMLRQQRLMESAVVKGMKRKMERSSELREGLEKVLSPIDDLFGGIFGELTSFISKSKDMVVGTYKIFTGTKDFFLGGKKDKQYDVARENLEKLEELSQKVGLSEKVQETIKRVLDNANVAADSANTWSEKRYILTEAANKANEIYYKEILSQGNKVYDGNQQSLEAIEKALNKIAKEGNFVVKRPKEKKESIPTEKQFTSTEQLEEVRLDSRQKRGKKRREARNRTQEIVSKSSDDSGKISGKSAEILSGEVAKLKNKSAGTGKEDKGPTEPGMFDIPQFFSPFERGSTAGPIERLYVRTKELIVEGGKQGVGGIGQSTEKKSSIKDLIKGSSIGKKLGLDKEGSFTDIIKEKLTEKVLDKMGGKVFGKGAGKAIGGGLSKLAGPVGGVIAAGAAGIAIGTILNKTIVDPMVQSVTGKWEKERVSKEDAEMNAKVADLKRRKDENILRKKQQTVTDVNIKKENNLVKIKEDIQTEDKKQLKQMKEVSEDGFFAKLLRGVFGGGGNRTSKDVPQTGPSAVQGGEGKVSLSNVEEAQYIAKAKGKGISFKGGKGLTQEQKTKIAAAGAQYGIDPKALEAMAMMESGGNPNAVSKTGAVGMYQFTKGTAEEMGLTNRYDETANIVAGARLYAKNRDTLRKKLKREPTTNEIYLAHQQGAGGASQIIRAAETGNESLISTDVRRNMNLNNGTGLTSKQFIGLQSSKLASAAGATGITVPTQVASTPTQVSKNELQKTTINETAKAIKKVENKNAKLEVANQEKLATVMTENKDAISNIKPEGGKTIVMNSSNNTGQYIDSDKIFSMMGLVYG